MAKTLVSQGNATGVSLAFGVTSYNNPCGTLENGSKTTEANASVPFTDAATLSNYYFYITVNTTNGTSTFRSRNAGSNGNMAASVAGAATGEFKDYSNTDSISAGALVNFQRVIGGSSGALTCTTAAYILDSGNSNTIMNYGNGSSGGLTRSSSSDVYFKLSGIGAPTDDETFVQTQISHAPTFRRLRIYISANAQTGAATLRFRINAGNGTQVVSITALTTGAFQDTTHTDTVADGDLVDFLLTCPGSENITIQTMSMEGVTTNGKFTVPGDQNATIAAAEWNNNLFYGIGGSSHSGPIVSPVEAATTVEMNMEATISRLWLNFSFNSLDNDTTFTLRKNGADTALTVFVPAGEIGKFEDATNSVSITSTDEVVLKEVCTATSGSVFFQTYSVLVTEAGGVVASTRTTNLSLLGAGT